VHTHDSIEHAAFASSTAAGVGPDTWWLACLLHNWVAHPLEPVAEMLAQVSDWIRRLHDWSAGAFEPEPEPEPDNGPDNEPNEPTLPRVRIATATQSVRRPVVLDLDPDPDTDSGN
jgi:hypothetical protein